MARRSFRFRRGLEVKPSRLDAHWQRTFAHPGRAAARAEALSSRPDWDGLDPEFAVRADPQRGEKEFRSSLRPSCARPAWHRVHILLDHGRLNPRYSGR